MLHFDHSSNNGKVKKKFKQVLLPSAEPENNKLFLILPQLARIIQLSFQCDIYVGF